MIGVMASGITYLILAKFAPQIEDNRKLEISMLVGLVLVVIAASFLAKNERSPFAATWDERIAQSRYGSGLPSRQHMLTITEEDKGLKVADDAVLADGSQRHVSYQLNPDGAEHPDPTGKAGTVKATIKGTSLETVFRNKAGVVLEQETASLSADGKEMTVKLKAYPPGEPDSTDVLQFERK